MKNCSPLFHTYIHNIISNDISKSGPSYRRHVVNHRHQTPQGQSLQSMELSCRIFEKESKLGIKESEGNMFTPIFKDNAQESETSEEVCSCRTRPTYLQKAWNCSPNDIKFNNCMIADDTLTGTSSKRCEIQTGAERQRDRQINWLPLIADWLTEWLDRHTHILARWLNDWKYTYF